MRGARLRELERMNEMDTMLQQVMTEPGKIEFREIAVPAPQVGEVLVKVMKIGVCGSDIHVYHGKHPFTQYPVTQGHEVSGKVAALGEGVTGFSVGQKVTIEPQVYCGRCYPCTHGKYNLCEELKVMGFQTVGTASEYVAVDASKVTALPETMSFDEGAMIEPLAVTVHAVKRAGDVRGQKIAVLGAGPIGILLAQSAKALGAAQVLVTDISTPRLELAKLCGADFAVNTKERDFGEALTACFGPDKADVIYDCAGNDITMGQAIKHARKGSTIILVAVYAGMATVDLAVLNDHELDLNTSMMYRHEDYLEAIRLVEEGKIRLRPLMSRHFAFRDYLAAYAYIDANRETTMKVLIDVDGSEA
jgi:L-iditol 2-dehydrogenase